MALSSGLHTQCRATLLKCSEFDNLTSLRSVFVTSELIIYRDSLPQSINTKQDLVSQTVSALQNRRLSDGRSVLTLLVAQLRDLRNEGDALRDELDELHSKVKQETEETPPVKIPFVVAAMKAGEANALIEGTVFDAPTVAPVERARFQRFREALEAHGIEDLQSHYGEQQEDWQPYHCQQSTIRDIILDTLDRFNQQQAPGARPLQMPPLFISSGFFSEEEDVRINSWDWLSRKGCIIIIDAVSMFHPRLHRIVSRSEMGSNDRVAVLTLSPVNSSTLPVNQLIESHISSQMQRAFARFDRYLDKLCEFGLGDLRAIQRWLFATLPETAAIVQGQRATPSSRRVLRERMGKPRGMGEVIFGRGGER
jgi:hypothetical protein